MGITDALLRGDPWPRKDRPGVKVRMRPNATYGHKYHALDCPFASSDETGPWVDIQLSKIPFGAEPCGFCRGGGV
jgi:hypothetical protein